MWQYKINVYQCSEHRLCVATKPTTYVERGKSPLTPTKNELKFIKKGCENMRNRTVGINVRVNENEKKKLQKNAKKSGLSLSAYLRKTGLKQEIYPIPNKDFYKIYLDICKVKDNIYNVELEKIEQCLAIIEKNFLEIYNSKSSGDDNGND